MSERARILIEENRQTKNPTLKLNNCNLTGSEEYLSTLEELTHLKSLELSYNNISDVAFFRFLSHLSTLSLTGNHISDFSFLRLFNNLQELIITGIHHPKFNIPHNLKTLQSLTIESGTIHEIHFNSNFDILHSLTINHCQLEKIVIKEDLRKLETLDLFVNHVSDISFINKMPALKKLILTFNQISIIPFSIVDHPQLKSIGVYGNPIKNIPNELFQDGHSNEHIYKDFCNYLKDISQGTSFNNEIKIILIGNGSVGKSQIAGRLVDNGEFSFEQQHDSTHAISLGRASLYHRELNREIFLNIWDFGGQDLYHATHRLFMQSKAIFLLVWDLENENKEFHEWKEGKYSNEKLTYWLQYAALFGKESPVLVLQNKTDNPIHKEYTIPVPEQSEYRGSYPIIDFLQLSAKTGKGFQALYNRLKETIFKCTVLKEELLREIPTSWLHIRDRVRQEQGQTNGALQISIDRFQQWCDEVGVKESTVTILGFLHETGVLYYHQTYFSGRIILDQAWAIKAIYQLLDRDGSYFELLDSRKGILNYQDINKVWREYTDQEKELFVDFMLSSDLCFEITSNKEWNTPFHERSFVVPQLLPVEEPEYISLYEEKHQLTERHTISYQFLPSIFIQRFIVLSHKFAETKDMWQSGIFLSYETQYAVVKTDYKLRTITILYNSGADEFRQAIEDELEAINQNSSVKAQKGTISLIDQHLQKGYEKLEFMNLAFKTDFFRNPMTKEIKIFVSYSSKDRTLKKTLLKNLKSHLNHRNGLIYNFWDDSEIDLGANWEENIDQALQHSQMALLLVSASFTSSPFIQQKELAYFFEVKKKSGYLILPVLVRHYDFTYFEQLSTLQFFKTYYSDYEFTDPDIADDLLPLDELIEAKNPSPKLLQKYCKNLAEQIDRTARKHFLQK